MIDQTTNREIDQFGDFLTNGNKDFFRILINIDINTLKIDLAKQIYISQSIEHASYEYEYADAARSALKLADIFVSELQLHMQAQEKDHDNPQ